MRFTAANVVELDYIPYQLAGLEIYSYKGKYIYEKKKMSAWKKSGSYQKWKSDWQRILEGYLVDTHKSHIFPLSHWWGLLGHETWKNNGVKDEVVITY